MTLHTEEELAIPYMVQGLVESKIDAVPTNFLVPIQDRPLPASLCPESLPVIDLSGLDRDQKELTMAAIARASEDWGFFQVIGHGIPNRVMEGTREAAKQFFKLPMKEKVKYADVNGTSAACYGCTEFFKGSADDWMDSLFGYFAPPFLKNVDSWPSEPTVLREMVELYGQESEKLLKRLLGIMSKNLGMESTKLEEAFADYTIFLRANYYPPCPQPQLVLGTHAHRDHGCLTILLQDKDMDGLQVCKDGKWFAVEPIPDALVINIGDKLQEITAGRYQSAKHRGVVSREKAIMTIVTHLDPPIHV